MVKLESLKKSNQFRKALKEKKSPYRLFFDFCSQEFFKTQESSQFTY